MIQSTAQTTNASRLWPLSRISVQSLPKFFWAGLLIGMVPTLAVAETRYPMIQPKDEIKFFKRTFPDERRESFFNYEGRPVTLELGETPIPFVDWSMVETGHIGWMGNDGEVVPLNGEHSYTDEKQILPVPFSLPSGIRIRSQKGEMGHDFSEWYDEEHPWEEGGVTVHTLFFDDEAGLYRVWYEAWGGLAYAESTDFVHWTKPLGAGLPMRGHTETNFLHITNKHERDTWLFQNLEEVSVRRFNTIFQDPTAPEAERFKTSFVASSDPEELRSLAEKLGKPCSPMVSPNSANCVYGAVSSDGIRWRIIRDPILFHDADTRTVTHFDPTIQKYVMYTRLFEFGRRSIARSETDDFRDFPLPRTIIATRPSERPSIDHYANACAFYPGRTDLRFIFDLVYDRFTDTSNIHLYSSRNGYLWDRIPGGPVLSPGSTDATEGVYMWVLPSLVKTPDGEMLVSYGERITPHKFPRYGGFGGGKDAMAVWKTDRLVAIEATERGEFTTPYIRLTKNHLQLNFRSERSGNISIELYDEEFKKIPLRTFTECDPLIGDDTKRVVSWNGDSDLSDLRDQLIYIRFKLRAATLFAISATD